MSLFINNNTIDEKSQAKIQRIADRILYKEKLVAPVTEIYTANSFRASAEEKAKRFSECGKYLEVDAETGQIKKANFCKERLCPVCNYLKSCNNWRKIKATIENIREKDKSLQFIFLTLTIKNCAPEELSDKIDQLLSGFKRLTNRKTWKASITGTLRGLEITYNPEQNTFHPHIHILASVPEKYFTDNYITIEKLREWWKESAKIDYFVQVDIRATSGDDEAISEIAKYSIKTAEILKANTPRQQLDAISKMQKAVYGRRLIATTGIIKETMRLLNLGDFDEVISGSEPIGENIKLIWSDNGKIFKEFKYE